MQTLQGFHSQESRDMHFSYCKDNRSVGIEMPKEGSFAKSTHWQNQFKVPFVMYVDFESILKPKEDSKPKEEKK